MAGERKKHVYVFMWSGLQNKSLQLTVMCQGRRQIQFTLWRSWRECWCWLPAAAPWLPWKKKWQDGRKRGWKQRGAHTEREERKCKHEPQAVNQLQDVCCIVVLLKQAIGKGVTLQGLHLDTIVNIYYHQLSLARLLCSLFQNYVIDSSGILTLASFCSDKVVNTAHLQLECQQKRRVYQHITLSAFRLF